MKYERDFLKILQHIINSIETAGYDADNQIIAYALTGDDDYITRQGNARMWIHKIDREDIKEYYGL